MRAFFESLDWSPLIISLKTGVAATIFCFFLGIFTARKVMKMKGKQKLLIEWNLDASDGSSSNRGRIFFAFTFQQKKTAWYAFV